MEHFHDCKDREIMSLLKDFSTSYQNNTLAPNADKCITFWVEGYTNSMHVMWQKVIFNNMFSYRQDALKPIRFKRVKNEQDAIVKIFFREN